MAFMGRRKPGFAEERGLTKDDLVGEFSDRNDPARRTYADQNPNIEKAEWKKKADEVMGEESAEQTGDAEQKTTGGADDGREMTKEELLAVAAAEGTKPDLLQYLDSLPDVEDPFPPSAAEPEKPEEPKLKESRILADFITERTKGVQLTPKSKLKEEIENLDQLIAEMEADPECAGIHHVQGANDVFYYDSEHMTDNYAMIAVLVEDKDIPNTIAQMTRFNCKTYPSPTPTFYFTRHPYYMSNEEVMAAIDKISADPRFADIKVLKSKKGSTFFYSSDILSAKYARALADFGEEEETD